MQPMHAIGLQQAAAAAAAGNTVHLKPRLQAVCLQRQHERQVLAALDHGAGPLPHELGEGAHVGVAACATIDHI
jgi:acyl-CoA reductase-like NAD-dependent aldehyde dehydrogenase